MPPGRSRTGPWTKPAVWGVRISVAVADEACALLVFARMDGATRLSARTSVAKTQTVILTGKATPTWAGNGARNSARSRSCSTG